MIFQMTEIPISQWQIYALSEEKILLKISLSNGPQIQNKNAKNVFAKSHVINMYYVEIIRKKLLNCNDRGMLSVYEQRKSNLRVIIALILISKLHLQSSLLLCEI